MVLSMHVLIGLLLPLGPSGLTMQAKQASRTPTVRMILTEQCGTYDLMVNYFVKHTQEVLGADIPFTILESCEDRSKSVKGLPSNVEVVEALTEKELAKAGTIKHKQNPQSSKYPWISRPYSVVKYFNEHDFTEDIIVLAEYDWVWLNPSLFWEWVGKVKPGEPVGVWYQYLEAGIKDPETISPVYKKDGKAVTSKSRELLNRKDEIQPVGVPIFILKDDMKKMMRGWADMTDDMLVTQENKGWPNHQRITEMYSYLTGALDAGLKHQVIHYSRQFSPGYWAPADRPLFGHFCYAFELCGRKFDKGYFGGPMDKVCHRTDLLKPPDPTENWFATCSYKETYWKSGGGDINAKKLAHEMLQIMYDSSQAVCKNVNLAEKKDLPPPVSHEELHDEHASHEALAQHMSKISSGAELQPDPAKDAVGAPAVQSGESQFVYETQEFNMVLATFLAFVGCATVVVYCSARSKEAEVQKLKRTRLLGEMKEFSSASKDVAHHTAHEEPEL